MNVKFPDQVFEKKHVNNDYAGSYGGVSACMENRTVDGGLIFLALGLIRRDNLLLNVGGNLVVVTEFHRVAALSAGHALEL